MEGIARKPEPVAEIRISGNGTVATCNNRKLERTLFGGSLSEDDLNVQSASSASVFLHSRACGCMRLRLTTDPKGM